MKSFFFCLFFAVAFLFAQTPPPEESKPSFTEVKTFLEKSNVEGIVFDGMFAGIEKLGPKTLDHLLTILQDSEENIDFRIMVLRAIAELGNVKAVDPLKALQSDLMLEFSLQEEIPFTLYHLGETQILDEMLKNVQSKIQKLQQQDTNQAKVKKQLLELYSSLANLAYRMKKYDLGCEAYAEIQKIYPNAEVLYNYACCLALAGKPEKAMEKLWEALANKELHSSEALEKDGDLRSLRDRADFQDLLKQLKAKLEGNY